MNRNIEEQARDFWRWFSSVANDFASNFENDAILRELDARVSSFGQVTWEVGPGLEKPNALVISPNGDSDLLGLTREVVALSPRLADWEFHPAKPPKQWDLRFVVEDVDGTPVEVDANAWEYVLLRFPDGTFDIVVCAPNLEDGHQETRQRAAEVAIEGVLGEICKIEHVGGIEPVTAFEDKHKGKATNLKHLAAHMRSLLSA
jgi:hypothetical protein